jgi:hypothetical protein
VIDQHTTQNTVAIQSEALRVKPLCTKKIRRAARWLLLAALD